MGKQLHFDEKRLEVYLETARREIEELAGERPVEDFDVFDYIEAVTGHYIRAKCPETGEIKTADVYFLTKESMVDWLRSRGEKNEWAEGFTLNLLGY